MKTCLLIAALLANPSPVTDLDILIRAQQAATIHDIRIEIQADLEQRGADFLAADGELQRLLDRVVIIDKRLAAR